MIQEQFLNGLVPNLHGKYTCPNPNCELDFAKKFNKQQLTYAKKYDGRRCPDCGEHI